MSALRSSEARKKGFLFGNQLATLRKSFDNELVDLRAGLLVHRPINFLMAVRPKAGIGIEHLVGLAEDVTCAPARLARENVQHVAGVAVLLQHEWQAQNGESGRRQRNAVTVRQRLGKCAEALGQFCGSGFSHGTSPPNLLIFSAYCRSTAAVTELLLVGSAVAVVGREMAHPKRPCKANSARKIDENCAIILAKNREEKLVHPAELELRKVGFSRGYS